MTIRQGERGISDVNQGVGGSTRSAPPSNVFTGEHTLGDIQYRGGVAGGWVQTRAPRESESRWESRVGWGRSTVTNLLGRDQRYL